MAEHIVSSYDNDLQGLRQRISEMGGIAEKMLVDSIVALVRHDKSLAQTVITSDARLDVLQRDVEESAILTIARRQPLAVDLRETISAIRVSGDVERIGDLAVNISERVISLAGMSVTETPRDLEGRRVGIPAWANSANVWARGALQHYYEVDLTKIQWLARRTGDVKPPDGISLQQAPSGSLSELLASGADDGTAILWDAVAGPGLWGWAQMLPHFRWLEGNQKFNDRFHGSDGPLN